MGTCQSSKSPQLKNAELQSKRIEKELKPSDQQLQKMLLLGPGESGKSTVLKQMIILKKNGFTAEEMEDRKGIINGNIILPLVAILNAMENLQIELEDAELQSKARALSGVVEATKEMEALTPDVVDAVKKLWADHGVQRCYGRRSEFQLNDSAKYFIESVDRISAADYVPTERDMLFTRVATIGVVEITFVVDAIEFRVFDVGGQKSERRKWIHCFDDVNSVIFIVAISEYDQRLREDENVNRMDDAFKLFEEICNNQYFSKSSMILFLNKTDLFRTKIENVPLSDYFPDYEGGPDYAQGVRYLKTKFEALNAAPKTKSLYVHETCATDTNQVQLVIGSVLDAVIQKLMKKSGLE